MTLKVRLLYKIFGYCLFADGERAGWRHVSLPLSNVRVGLSGRLQENMNQTYIDTRSML